MACRTTSKLSSDTCAQRVKAACSLHHPRTIAQVSVTKHHLDGQTTVKLDSGAEAVISLKPPKIYFRNVVSVRLTLTATSRGIDALPSIHHETIPQLPPLRWVIALTLNYLRPKMIPSSPAMLIVSSEFRLQHYQQIDFLSQPALILTSSLPLLSIDPLTFNVRQKAPDTPGPCT